MSFASDLTLLSTTSSWGFSASISTKHKRKGRLDELISNSKTFGQNGTSGELSSKGCWLIFGLKRAGVILFFEEDWEPVDSFETGKVVCHFVNFVILVPQVGQIARIMLRPLAVFSIVV